jgi:hypothetical protein
MRLGLAPAGRDPVRPPGKGVAQPVVSPFDWAARARIILRPEPHFASRKGLALKSRSLAVSGKLLPPGKAKKSLSERTEGTAPIQRRHRGRRAPPASNESLVCFERSNQNGYTHPDFCRDHENQNWLENPVLGVLCDLKQGRRMSDHPPPTPII